jgi:hypothetical protein
VREHFFKQRHGVAVIVAVMHPPLADSFLS